MTAIFNPSNLTKIAKGDRLGDIQAIINAIQNANSNNSAYNLTATGSALANALQLTSVINQIDTVASSAGVILPSSSGKAGTACQHCIVINNGANTLQVYGLGDSINGTAGATGVAQTAGTTTLYTSAKKGAWFSISGGGGGGAVSSVFGRTGAVTAQTGDYSVAQITGAAPIAFPGTYNAGPSSTAITINWANGACQVLTVTANTTITFSGAPPVASGVGTLILLQTGATNYTTSYAASSGTVLRANGSTPEPSSGPSRDRLTVAYDSVTNCYDIAIAMQLLS